MGYAARRAEIELLKGGPSIAVSGTTSVTAEADRTYRGGLMPAALVRDQWGRWVKMIFSIWQTEVDCMAERARQRWRHVQPGIALRSGEAPVKEAPRSWSPKIFRLLGETVQPF